MAGFGLRIVQLVAQASDAVSFIFLPVARLIQGDVQRVGLHEALAQSISGRRQVREIGEQKSVVPGEAGAERRRRP